MRALSSNEKDLSHHSGPSAHRVSHGEAMSCQAKQAACSSEICWNVSNALLIGKSLAAMAASSALSRATHLSALERRVVI